MIRTPLILVASFGLLAGCATSSANSPSNNPDAGKVNYDAGQPSSGSGGASDGGSAGSGSGTSATAPKGVDATSTHTAPTGPKTVKKIASAKPPKKDEPVDPNKPVPKRKGRVDPNGLLGESFAIDASATTFAEFGTAASVFIAPSLEAGRLPTTLKAPVQLRFTGSLNVTEAHEYKFCAKSSDGSKFMIEGTVVVSNDGVHKDAVEVCEVVQLEPGEYGVEVHSFHVSGAVDLTIGWATSKDGTAAPIPKTNFFKPEGADDKVKAAKK